MDRNPDCMSPSSCRLNSNNLCHVKQQTLTASQRILISSRNFGFTLNTFLISFCRNQWLDGATKADMSRDEIESMIPYQI